MTMRIAEHIEIDWLSGRTATATCPNCGFTGVVEPFLFMDYRPADDHFESVLQICPACTVRFVDNTRTIDYATEELIEIGWKSYQVQLGAGLWAIAAPLARVRKPAGARVLEIGGAFGFGLDFCVRAKHWRGEGFDPSQLASFGSDSLGLKIRQDYFGAANLAEGPWDVVIATEVIEHLHHPVEFFELMRRALTPDGMLVLTTPDAACIQPDLDAGSLMPLLSPRVHVVLQTATSFEHGLRRAGFAHVQVLRSEMTLVAYASCAPFTLDEDEAAGRALFRAYLVDRAKLTEPLDDMRLGFAGRGIFEASNDMDYAGAERAWAALVPAVQARFGIDLTKLAPLPAAAFQASLAELTDIMPLGLGMILFGRAMQLIGQSTPRAVLRDMFRQARTAIDVLQAALARRSLIDRSSASLGCVLDDELLLCDAELGDASCIAGLVARGSELLGWRAFAALMQARALDAAKDLQNAMNLRVPSATLPFAARRDAFLTLANLELAGGEPMQALRHAESLRGIGASADETVLAAFTALVNEARYAEAQAVAAAENVKLLARQAGASEAGSFARAALLMLDLRDAAADDVFAAMAGAELSPAAENLFLCEVFIRLVNASRHEEAGRFFAQCEIAARAATLAPHAGNNVRVAQIMLELAVGDPVEVPGRLAGVELTKVKRDTLMLDAFIRLVTAKRFDEAQGFFAAHGIAALAAQASGAIAANTALARAMLELSAGDPVRLPALLADLKIPAERQDPLILAAFTRLVSTERFQAAAAFYAAQDVAGRTARSSGAPARDAGLARVFLDLAAGDPADVPKRLPAIDIEPAAREALLLEAFMGLVNAARYADALAFEAAHEVPRLTARAAAAVAGKAAQARILLELAAGDPAAVPARVAALPDLADERRDAFLLETFVRLAGAGRVAEAVAFRAAHDVAGMAARLGGAPARNAVLAQIGLDVADVAAVERHLTLLPANEREAVLLEALAIPVDQKRFQDAHAFVAAFGLEAAAARADRPDGAFTLALLDILAGDPLAVPGRLAARSGPQAAGLLLGAFATLVGTGRFDDAERIFASEAQKAAALQAAPDGASARLADIALNLARGRRDAALAGVKTIAAMEGGGALRLECFVRLVNAGEAAAAAALSADKRFAGELAAAPERLRHDVLTADLFLACQAGETDAILLRLDAVRAGGMAATRVGDLTCAAFVALVNRSEHKVAKLLMPAVEPLLLAMRPPFAEAQANTLFAAGMLYLQERETWRRSTAILARLRDATMQATPPGREPPALFWPAMRAEVMGLQRQKRGEDSVALLRLATAKYPGAPDDLMEHITKKKRIS